MNICVFCSSSNSVDPIYFKEAENLGKELGKRKDTLVYGGTNVGLMNQVAISTKNNGGKTIGIIPKLIHNHGIAADFLDELIVTEDMKERKELLRTKSDALITLPGGFGTLEEVLEVITLKQLGYHSLPIVLINIDGFYDDLKAQFEKSYEEKFAKKEYQKLFYFADNYQDTLEYIDNYQQEDMQTKWD